MKIILYQMCYRWLVELTDLLLTMKVGAGLCMPGNPWFYKFSDIGSSETSAHIKIVLFGKQAAFQQKIHICLIRKLIEFYNKYAVLYTSVI